MPRIATRGLVASILALALASPARADKLPCEGIMCILAIPVGLAYVGAVQLAPSPVLIKALHAMHEGDMPKLKRLVNAHLELVRLTAEQTEAMAKMANATDWGQIEDRYVLSLLPETTVEKGDIERSIAIRDWKKLEYRLKTNRQWAAAVDNGYVLLVDGARTGNLDAVRLLLDAGVPADTHKGGALREARGEEMKQLLLSRAATSLR